MSDLFWSHVQKGEGCWEWQAARAANGYGRAFFEGRVQSAHRIAFQLVHGPVPSWMVIRHTCDNPPCVRPDHLLTGTQADNVADSIRRGRSARGVRHGMHKLTPDDVVDIRRLRADGRGLRHIAADFAISEAEVSLIARGLKWPDVGGPISAKDRRWR
jgi:hypothetical protein